MLVLSRKEREEIVIGDNIRLTVIEVSGNRVRLSFEAPLDVAIRRVTDDDASLATQTFTLVHASL